MPGLAATDPREGSAKGRRTALRVSGMAALAAIAHGCLSAPAEPEPGPGGHIWTRPGRAGFVIAAPHDGSDSDTNAIAAELARRSGFGLVIATGFTLDHDSTARVGRRDQVDRPTEGIPGRPPSEEVETAGSRQIGAEYERRVRETAQAPLALYVEIRGNSRPESAGRLEIATVGVDEAEPWRLRTLLEMIRDARLRAHPGAPRLNVLVEALDPIRYTASGPQQTGILRLPARAWHVEIPRAARTDWRALYTDILADFLVQASRFVEPPR
jgi:hypothetical protein